MAATSDYTNSKLEKCIAQLHYNSTIDLSGGTYTDKDMEIVVEQAIKGKQCKELVLHHNTITQEGALKLAEALRNNTSLEKLNLGYNNIGDTGVKYLVDALLNSNKTLVKLHLQSNSITEKGAGHLADMLKINRSIRHLGLDYNSISDRGVQLLSLALGSNSVEVDHASNCEVSDDDYFCEH
jgi:Ran GTPase-activating protein (RanGAP) involved in mRNA processing and transport